MRKKNEALKRYEEKEGFQKAQISLDGFKRLDLFQKKSLKKRPKRSELPLMEAKGEERG